MILPNKTILHWYFSLSNWIQRGPIHILYLPGDLIEDGLKLLCFRECTKEIIWIKTRLLLLIGYNPKANVVNSRFYKNCSLCLEKKKKKKMLYATTKLFAIIALIYTVNITYAFNIKEVLFGNKAAVTDKSTPSFGRPMQKRSPSNRAGKTLLLLLPTAMCTEYWQFNTIDIPCDGYICEDTESCVSTPSECPCRLETEIKCAIGDWYVCIRGDQLCPSVQWYMPFYTHIIK